jgi:hypothetical protein
MFVLAHTWEASSSSKVFDPYPESTDQILAAFAFGGATFGESIVTSRRQRRRIASDECWYGVRPVRPTMETGTGTYERGT